MKSFLQKKNARKPEIYRSDFKCGKSSKIFNDTENSVALRKSIKPCRSTLKKSLKLKQNCFF